MTLCSRGQVPLGSGGSCRATGHFGLPIMVKGIARDLMGNGVLKGSATALAIKFAAAIVGFAMFALSSRYMEPASFGSLAAPS